MTLKDLQCFIAAYEAGSSVGATKIARTAQSNISRRIRLLEKALGVDLFTRVRYGMEATPEGKKLYPMARRVLQDIERIQGSFSGGKRRKHR